MDPFSATILGGVIGAFLLEKLDRADMQNPASPFVYPSGAAPYVALITQTEQTNGIPAGLLGALLKQESGYRPAVISGQIRSSTGAIGIAQFMPATAREWLGSEAAALDPNKAIPGAGRYLAWLAGQLGDWRKAVIAYNWGIGNVQRKGINSLPGETSNYVAVVYDRYYA